MLANARKDHSIPLYVPRALRFLVPIRLRETKGLSGDENASPQETLRFSGNKINCLPWEQSLCLLLLFVAVSVFSLARLKSSLTFCLLVESSTLRTPPLVVTGWCYDGWIWYLAIFHSQSWSTFYFRDIESCWRKNMANQKAGMCWDDVWLFRYILLHNWFRNDDWFLASYIKWKANRVLLCTLVKVNDPWTLGGQSINLVLEAIISLQ